MFNINVANLNLYKILIVLAVILLLFIVSFATDRVILLAGAQFGLIPQTPKMERPDYDSDWKTLTKCNTLTIDDLEFEDVPSLVMAFYKIKTRNGEESIIPWGINQYGDSWQTNGVLLDFEKNVSEDKIYLHIRTPCRYPKERRKEKRAVRK